MTTHLSRLRIWFYVTCVLLVFQGVVFGFTPPYQRTVEAPDSAFSQIWPYIDQLEYENNDVIQGRALRWAPMQGIIRIPRFVHANSVIVKVTTHTARSLEQSPMSVSLQSNQTTTSIELNPGWRTLSLLVMPASPTEQYATLRYNVSGPILSERRDLGLAVTSVTMAQTARPQIDGVRFLFVALLWLWVIPLGILRRWPLWYATLPAIMSIGTWMLLPHVMSYQMPNQWNLVGYIWLMTAVVLCLPHRRAYLSPMWSLVGVLIAVSLWHMGFGWLGVIVLSATGLTSASWPPVVWPSELSLLRWQRWVLVGVVLVAGLLRIAWLNDYPTGLFRDEARHGSLAWRILAGEWMVYSPLANLPAGYFYLSAIPVALFDASAWSIRIVAALVGTISVLAIFWMLRPQWGPIFGVWASVVMATLLWHVGLSRIGFPATLGPLLTIIAVGAWIRITQTKWPIAWAAVAGIATGLMLMVYHSARLMPLVVVVTIIFVLWQQRWAWRNMLSAIIVFCGVAMLTASPIVWYAFTQPDNYMRRIGVTSIISDAHIRGVPIWVALFDNFHAYIGMLFVAGDRNPRHFYLGAPQLNIFEATAFVVGCIWLWTKQKPWLLWVMAWLCIGLVSGVLSVDAPHALRTVESIVPIVIIVAAGIYRMTQFISRQWVPIVLVCVLISNGTWSVSNYYAWQTNPRTQSRFDTSATNDVRFVQQLAYQYRDADTIVYVPESMRRSDLGVFLLYGSGVRVWQGNLTELDMSLQHLILVPQSVAMDLPDSAVQVMDVPNTTRERYQLWCIGHCVGLTRDE
ncbi:MAG: ArnT family glycosyltransferase [Roseiflexaceae bacterium]